MDNKLYLIDNGMAKEMQVKKYEKEADLQEIIKDNPNLLARAMEDGTCKKLYLIKQEYSIKELEYGSISYSLDHLMVDEEGIPVLVEVKRSTDTRIKREVVAQMLDYASRASKWNIDDLIESYKNSNNEMEIALDDTEFWDKVSTNLAAEHFRLVFAADDIPDTLRVLIEFLDRTMKDIEVYGVELRPYTTTDGALLISSNIIGNSTLDSTKITTSGKRPVRLRTVDEFRDEFRKMGLTDCIPIFEKIFAFGNRIGLIWESGTGEKHPAYLARIGTQTLFRIVMWKSQGAGKALLEFGLLNLSKLLNGKKDKEEIREALINFSNKEDLKRQGFLGCPGSAQYIYFNALKDPENLDYLLEVIKQLSAEILSSQQDV